MKGNKMSEETKRVSDSITEQVQIIMPEQINGFNRLFGGKLVEWMDVVAAVVARRHSGRNVTTASITNLQFTAPAYVNDTIVLRGKVTYVGNTSMEIKIEAFTEALGGDKKLINTAYFVLVALDGNEHPVRVPRLELETDEDRAEWDAAVRRKAEARKV